jgi:hypothetical protein
MKSQAAGSSSQRMAAAHAAPPTPASAPKADPEKLKPKDQFIVLATLRDKATGGPLGGARYEIAGGAGGRTQAPQALIDQGVPAAGSYALKVLELAEERFPPAAAGKALAEASLTARKATERGKPADVSVDVGVEPRLTWVNHDGKPVAQRHLWLVAGDRQARAVTDEKGVAKIRLAPDAPKLTVYASKSEATLEELEHDLREVEAGRIAKRLDGFAEDLAPGKELKLNRLHRSRIERALLPRGAAVVKRLAKGGIDSASCDVCSGITVAVLKALGYAPELNDSQVHVCVRVRPPGEPELFIDLSMPQFFRNRSPIDTELNRRGGWIGTRDELTELCRKHLHDNNFHQNPDIPWSMQRAQYLLQIQLGAEAAGRKALAADAKAQLAAEQARWGFDDANDDVYHYQEGTIKRSLWQSLQNSATPLPPALLEDVEARSITAYIDAEFKPTWEEDALKRMLTMWEARPGKDGNTAGAKELAGKYEASPASYPDVTAIIDSESDPKPT